MTVLVGLRYAEGAVVAATAHDSPEYRCMVKLAVQNWKYSAPSAYPKTVVSSPATPPNAPKQAKNSQLFNRPSHVPFYPRPD